MEISPADQKKILLVEDDPFIADVYLTSLKKEGFLVKHVDDGSLVLPLLKKESFDLVLLDLVLPGMDGFEILKEIKESPELKEIPVIILTNLNERENIEKGVKLGAVDYIVKSNFSPTEVIGKIKNLFAGVV